MVLEYATFDFKRFDVEPNQMFFNNDGKVHEWVLSEDTIGYTLFFKKEFFEVVEKSLSLQALPFFNNISNNVPLVVFSDEQSKTIESLFEEIIKELQINQAYRDSQVKSILKLILVHSIRIYQPIFKGNGNTLNVSKIRLFENLIEIHYKNLKLVKDFAGKLKISASYLNAVCKETIGRTA